MSYQIFISYRRKGASELAELLYARLKSDGYQVFYDRETMRSGKFNKQIYDRIDECSDILVLLSPHALDPRDTEEDWVRLEIAHALKQEKNIIPILMEGFQMPQHLPKDIDDFRYCTGVKLHMDYFNAVLEKLNGLLTSSPSITDSEKTSVSHNPRLTLEHLIDQCVATHMSQHKPNSTVDPLDQLILEATHGDMDAQYSLGCKYAKGLGIQQDDSEAIRWFDRAAKQNHIEAQYIMGCCYETGGATLQKDLSLAAKWYAASAHQNYPLAQFRFAECLFMGLGIEPDEVEAMKWYRKAAEQGLAKAQDFLGLAIECGMGGLVQDETEAAAWYRKAAEQGNVSAQLKLAEAYENGYGVEKDIVAAVKWYVKAAEQGDAVAEDRLRWLLSKISSRLILF